MPKQKFDGVIEAVRYISGGEIDKLRIYVRRRSVFSDRIILSRKDLLDYLLKDRKFVTGKRIPGMGNSFETYLPVNLLKQDGSSPYISTRCNSSGDDLENVPLF